MRLALLAVLAVLHGIHAPKPAPPTTDRAAVSAFDTTAYVSNPGWFEGMAARGFRLYIMHSTSWGTCIPWPEAQRQAADALAAGLEIAAYSRDPRCWQNGITALGPLASQLRFFALDIETVPGVAATETMVKGVRAAGVQPVIYSGSRMWPTVQGWDDRQFASVPLWDAAPGTPTPYGGWNTVANPRAMVQEAREVMIDGVAVDIDSISTALLGSSGVADGIRDTNPGS